MAASLLAACASAQTVPPNVTLWAPQPGNDFAPVFSPDGRWLVFVSESDGDTDLGILRSDRPPVDPPVALFPSAAEDDQPAFSPDGKWLAWRSTREDVFGDIWVTRFPGGEPFTVSTRGPIDRDPQWTRSPDGVRLQWTAADHDGGERVLSVRAGAWKTVDEVSGATGDTGPKPVLQYEDDTNGDGEASARSGDAPSVWMPPTDGGAWRQLTPPLPGLGGPVFHEGKLVFSARFRQDLDIAIVDEPFAVATVSDAQSALALAREARALRPLRPFDAVSIARQGFLLEADSAAGLECALFAIDVLRDATRPEQALRMVRNIERIVAEDAVASARLAVRRLALEPLVEERRGLVSAELDDARMASVAGLREIAARSEPGAELRALALREAARLQASRNDVAAGLLLLDEALAIGGIDDATAAQIRLQSARMTRRLGTDQAAGAYDRILASPGNDSVSEDAALERVALAIGGVRDAEARAIAVRRLVAAAPEIEVLRAAASLEEGATFAAAARTAEAREALRDAIALDEAAPRIAALASFELARSFASEGLYLDAVRTYRTVGERLRNAYFDAAPRFVSEAREGFIREFLARGDEELRLGDPQLASATFRQLLDEEPRLVEAWRGLIEAEHRAGRLDGKAVGVYRRDARRRNDDALAWYLSGLAQTYADPASKRAAGDIRRAVALDGSVPYFHQTLGFIHEAVARKTGSRQEIASAWDRYQRALSLLDPASRPRDYARLLVNAGNAAFGLGLNPRAAEMYQRRLDQGIPFDDPRTEFLMARQHAIALFRSFRANAAAARFDAARESLDELRRLDLVDGDTAFEIETELLDRRALALLDAGRFASGAKEFGIVAERSSGRSMNRARSLRNRGIALYRLAQEGGPDFEETRLAAVRSLEEALALVESRDLEIPKADEPGGIFGFSFGISSDQLGGAALNLTPQDERRLVLAALARLEVLGGDRERAIGRIRDQLAAAPAGREGTEAYHSTVELVALDQLADQQRLAGMHREAARTLLGALDGTRVMVDEIPVINAAGMTNVLVRLAELALAGGDDVLIAAELRDSWLAPDEGGSEPLRVLDAMLRDASSLRDPAGEYVFGGTERRAWLQLARALLAERLALADEPGSGLDAHRAELLANAVIAAAGDPSATVESRRLAVLAHGLLLRTGARFAPETLVERRARAATFADSAGRGDMRWWLSAQEAYAAGPELARAAAFKTLDEIERLPPAMWNDAAPVPWPLLDRCRRLAIDAAFDTEADPWPRVFGLVQRWQTAELRLASAGASPLRARNADEQTWLDEALRLRARARAATNALRASAPGPDHASARERYNVAIAEWTKHIDGGMEGHMLAARFFSARVFDVENPAAAMTELAVLPVDPAVVLTTHRGSAAWTAEGFRELDSAARADLAESHSLWFLFGDPLPEGPLPETAIGVLSLDLTALAMSAPTLDTGAAVEQWPGGDEAALPGETEKLRLVAPVRARGVSPENWLVGSTGKSFGRVFAAASPDSLFAARTTGTDEHATRLLAAACAAAGVTEVRIDGRTWSSALFPPSAMPQAAQDALDAAVGDIRAQLVGSETPTSAVAIAQRIAFLRRALDKPAPEVAEAGLLVAQTLGDLGRYAEAAEAAGEVVALWRGEGGDEELARALRIRGSYCNDARLFAESVAAFEEARDIYQGLGLAEDAATMRERLGVSFENAGRIREALDVYREILADASGDPAAEAEQLRRIGRLHLHRFIDYPQAEDSFRAALAKAEEAGSETLVIESTLDIARCRERLGDYDEALRLVAAMKTRAIENADPLLECDALLLECFVHWARADYFDAFNAQRAALRIVEETGDKPFAIIAHNYAGLIHWSLNDTGRALQEYDAALAIAREGLFDQEVASTLNNRALVHRSRSDFDDALADLDEALAIDRATGNRWGEAYALRNTGITLTQRGDWEDALEPLYLAVNIAGEIGDRVNRAKAVAAVADALRELGRDAEAHEYYLDALSESASIPLPEVHWRALYGRALLELKNGRRDSAQELLAQAIEIVETLRAAIRIEEFQDGFLLDKQDLYDEMIVLLLDDERSIEAFEYSERSRGRHFIDLLGNGRIDVGSIADGDALGRESELRVRIETLERRLSPLSGPQREAVARELALARQAYGDFLVELRAANPQLSSFVAVEPVDLAEIQALLDEGTRLVSWHVAANELIAWIVAPDRIETVRVPVSRTELASRIGAFRGRLQSFERVTAESAILSSWLVQPVLPHLGGARRIGIVPHRELHLMPFAALRADEGWLNDRFAIFHAPSASVLRYTFGRRSAERGEGILAIGNPDYGDEALDLPFAEKEAERLGLTFPGATVVTGAEATETWISKNIGRYAIVHIATHGAYDPNLPLMSAIRLASDGDNDGELTADEVFGLSLDADLVALSACQTGLGRLGNGDDVVGLNRSFVYAGTRQVLSTLWRVDDVSTAVLVKHFYRNLSDESIDRAEALRLAQIEVRKRYPHPAHWSGMVLSGDWQ